MQDYINYEEKKGREERPSEFFVEDMILELVQKFNRKFSVQDTKIEEMQNLTKNLIGEMQNITKNLIHLSCSISANREIPSKKEVSFHLFNTRKELLGDITFLRREIMRIQTDLLKLKEHQNDLARNKIAMLD